MNLSLFSLVAEYEMKSNDLAASTSDINIDSNGDIDIDLQNPSIVQHSTNTSISFGLLTGFESEESTEPLFGFPSQHSVSPTEATSIDVEMTTATINTMAKVDPVTKSARKKSVGRKPKADKKTINNLNPSESDQCVVEVTNESTKKSTSKPKSPRARPSIPAMSDNQLVDIVNVYTDSQDATQPDDITNSFVIKVDGADVFVEEQGNVQDGTNTIEIETDTDNDNDNEACFIVSISNNDQRHESGNGTNYYHRKTFKKEPQTVYEVKKIIDDWTDSECEQSSEGQRNFDALSFHSQFGNYSENNDEMSSISITSGDSSVAIVDDT